MDLIQRRNAILRCMGEAGIDVLVAASNGFHQIDIANPVAHLTGFRSLGPALAILTVDGLVVMASPSSDAERLAARVPDARIAVTDDLPAKLHAELASLPSAARRGQVGLGALRKALAERLLAMLGTARRFDDAMFAASAAKTAAEIAAARKATWIAERGYERLLEIARPGMPECNLAIAVNRFMKQLGANDSFLMLNAGPRADAVMPSSVRPIERGDLLLAELSPSVDGQFVQICRTTAVGEPEAVKVEKYELLARAMRAGIASVRPGAPMSAVCGAIDDYLSDAGYSQYSRPPFIRRRGHGLGGGSVWPGDVAVDNPAPLEAGMVFVVHPNQFLPETGYMMCGEPILVTETGAEVLSTRPAGLGIVAN